jgi:hypothetical protein
MDVNEGTANEIKTAAIATTTRSSTKVNPLEVFFIGVRLTITTLFTYW